LYEGRATFKQGHPLRKRIEINMITKRRSKPLPGTGKPTDLHIKFAMAAALASVAWNAAVAQEMSYGEAEYLNSCAVCHGSDAKGDGPLTDVLMKRPPDLTRLSERNGGRFPYQRVFAVIDGRYVVSGHGDRDMPVWGRQFLEEDAKVYGPSGGEIVTTERIHNLAGYIESLQRSLP
jgi:mono/diheme cytochrome c family protein